MSKNIFNTLIFICLLCGNAFCYDDETTHPILTEESIKKSQLNNYLVNNLNLQNGIETKIPSNSTDDIVDLLTKGSTLEDSPNCRAASHFLNPLKLWADAGVSDSNKSLLGIGTDAWCFVTSPLSSEFSIQKYSDVTWATGYTAPPSPTSLPIETGNDMDWNAARRYYELAVIEQDKSMREKYFAKSFQALGQVMHLLQDMAVPAHVRNDFPAQRLLGELS